MKFNTNKSKAEEEGVKPQIAEAAGAAGAGGGKQMGALIEAAMSDAVNECAKAEITDPEKIREAMLAARKAVVAAYQG